jgi:hypothetical protein
MTGVRGAQRVMRAHTHTHTEGKRETRLPGCADEAPFCGHARGSRAPQRHPKTRVWSAPQRRRGTEAAGGDFFHVQNVCLGQRSPIMRIFLFLLFWAGGDGRRASGLPCCIPEGAHRAIDRDCLRVTLVSHDTP